VTSRWGILGGIFDPIHYGHLTIAEQAREALDLTRVLFIPTGQPVHKESPRASGTDRLRMAELATADNPLFSVSSMEVEADRPSYSVDTLEQLSAEHPTDEFVLIMSVEAARALPGWRNPSRLLELAEVALVSRLGYDDVAADWLGDAFPGRDDRFHVVETSHLGHSSTEIRARVAAGKSIRYLVPAAVETYIGDNQLYRAASDGRTPAERREPTASRAAAAEGRLRRKT
jgi:nicotinate-nucleotide adenylyltransferase